MLSMRPNCECCDCDLPADKPGAMICSFECTFCQQCMVQTFDHTCPNCRGPVSPRPMRTGENLERNPGSDTRVLSRYEPVDQDGPKIFTRIRLLPVPGSTKN